MRPAPLAAPMDLDGLCIAAALRAGLIDAADARERRRVSLEAPSFHASVQWASMYGPLTRMCPDPAIVDEARARAPDVRIGTFHRAMWMRAHAGIALARIGRDDEAVTMLRFASRMAMVPRNPVLAAWAHLELAELLAARGDRDGARELLGTVIDRWGAAVPRSVTTERARNLLASLS